MTVPDRISVHISVHIDRLVLDRPAPDPGTLSDAVAQRLGELLTASGLHPGLAAGGSFASARAGAVAGSSTDAGDAGSEIAGALHTALGAGDEQ